MKHSKKCPKCGSDRVLKAMGAEMRERGENILPLGLFDWARIDRWICCACGYSEEWVDADMLGEVEKYWSKRQR